MLNLYISPKVASVLNIRLSTRPIKATINAAMNLYPKNNAGSNIKIKAVKIRAMIR